MVKSATGERIRRAQFELGYRNHVTAVGVTLLLPWIITAGYRTSLPQPQVWWWLGMMLLIGSMAGLQRLFARRMMRRSHVDDRFVTSWRRQYLLQTIFIGFGWGNLGMLYVPGNVTQNASLMLVFLGVGAGAAGTAGMHHLKAMTAGTVIGISINMLYLPRGFGDHALPMQISMILYMAVLLFVGRNINQLVRESILLRFENEEVLEQKTLEAARADRANHDKSMFLAAASHDLRQPVHALLLLVAALHQRVRDAATLELVGHIQKAGQAIGDLFNALMELSRLESGAEKAEPADVAVHELLSQAVERHRPQAQHKGLALRMFAASRLQRALVRTDAVLLGRIVDNLISNAIRYTPRGGVLVSLRMREPDQLWLEVWDSGIGIDDDSLPKIFDPYFQVGNAERDRSKGLGLGLAIVRKTADLLDCPIDVASRSGRGTRFRLKLAGAWLAQRRHAQPVVAETGAPDLKGRRILVIDDDPIVREAMLILLSGWQADLRLAADGEDCRRLLEREHWIPDCVLCDYRLPGPDNGIELLNMLVDRFPQVVAILQTGELDPGLRDMADDAGYMVLTKPVAAALLASTLGAVLPERSSSVET